VPCDLRAAPFADRAFGPRPASRIAHGGKHGPSHGIARADSCNRQQRAGDRGAVDPHQAVDDSELVLGELHRWCVKRIGPGARLEAQIADEASLPRSVLSTILSGKVQRIDFGTLEKLCKFLKVKPGDLIELVEEPEEVPQ